MVDGPLPKPRGKQTQAVERCLTMYARLLRLKDQPGKRYVLNHRLVMRMDLLSANELAQYYAGAQRLRIDIGT